MKNGDRVKKVGGDYGIYGTVISVAVKQSGAVRYVIEADTPRGLLHIYSAANLKPMTFCDEVKSFLSGLFQ